MGCCTLGMKVIEVLLIGAYMTFVWKKSSITTVTLAPMTGQAFLKKKELKSFSLGTFESPIFFKACFTSSTVKGFD